MLFPFKKEKEKKKHTETKEKIQKNEFLKTAFLIPLLVSVIFGDAFKKKNISSSFLHGHFCSHNWKLSGPKTPSGY